MSHSVLWRRHLSCQPAPGRPLQTLTRDSVSLFPRGAKIGSFMISPSRFPRIASTTSSAQSMLDP